MPIDETNLRAWLRQVPQPHHLLVITSDGEKHQVELTAAARNRWKSAEQAVLALEAVSVQCLSRDGKVIRAKKLGEGDNGEEEADPANPSRAIERTNNAMFAAQAAMLREQGIAIREAYNAGSEAANSSQSHLVELVAVLTAHLSHAITSLHTVSVNFANTMQAIANNADPPTQHDSNQAALLQLAAAAMTSGAIPGMGGAAAGGKPNGAAGKDK